MERQKQLESWLQGKSVHNTTDNECTPDFSCCEPGLLASSDERQKFARAYRTDDVETTRELLSIFFNRLLEKNFGSSQHNYLRQLRGEL